MEEIKPSGEESIDKKGNGKLALKGPSQIVLMKLKVLERKYGRDASLNKVVRGEIAGTSETPSKA